MKSYVSFCFRVAISSYIVDLQPGSDRISNKDLGIECELRNEAKKWNDGES